MSLALTHAAPLLAQKAPLKRLKSHTADFTWSAISCTSSQQSSHRMFGPLETANGGHDFSQISPDFPETREEP